MRAFLHALGLRSPDLKVIGKFICQKLGKNPRPCLGGGGDEVGSNPPKYFYKFELRQSKPCNRQKYGIA